MSSIFRRELKAFFHSPRGYVFWGIFLTITGIFVTVYHFYSYFAYANFEYTLPWFTVALALALPVLTIPLFSAERRDGSDRLLRSLPLSARDVIGGKYLLSVMMLLITAVIAAIYPLVLSGFGAVAYKSAYSAVLGYLLLGYALMSVCLYISVCLRKPMTAWLICYGVLLLLYALGRLAPLLPQPLRTVAEAVSLFGAYSPFVVGVLDLRVIVLYLSVSALFTLLTFRHAKREWTR